jgi:hypothetical protein
LCSEQNLPIDGADTGRNGIDPHAARVSDLIERERCIIARAVAQRAAVRIKGIYRDAVLVIIIPWLRLWSVQGFWSMPAVLAWDGEATVTTLAQLCALDRKGWQAGAQADSVAFDTPPSHKGWKMICDAPSLYPVVRPAQATIGVDSDLAE